MDCDGPVLFGGLQEKVDLVLGGATTVLVDDINMVDASVLELLGLVGGTIVSHHGLDLKFLEDGDIVLRSEVFILGSAKVLHRRGQCAQLGG